MKEYLVCFSCLAKLLKVLSKVAAVGAVVYALAFLKLGELTFVQHVSRIVHTSEFSDLKAGVIDKFSRTQSSMVEGVSRSLAASKFAPEQSVAAPELDSP
jgi:hypothetical protein